MTWDQALNLGDNERIIPEIVADQREFEVPRPIVPAGAVNAPATVFGQTAARAAGEKRCTASRRRRK